MAQLRRRRQRDPGRLAGEHDPYILRRAAIHDFLLLRRPRADRAKPQQRTDGPGRQPASRRLHEDDLPAVRYVGIQDSRAGDLGDSGPQHAARTRAARVDLSVFKNFRVRERFRPSFAPKPSIWSPARITRIFIPDITLRRRTSARSSRPAEIRAISSVPESTRWRCVSCSDTSKPNTGADPWSAPSVAHPALVA